MTLPRWPLERFGRGRLGVITVVVTAVVLVSLCYRAVAEWQGAAAMVAERRARATVDMFVTAFIRDMRGAQGSLLAPARLDDPSDLTDRMSSGFARFQYPESFFVWQDPSDAGTVLLYVRPDRYPPWLPAHEQGGHLPMVSIAAGASIAGPLTTRVTADAAKHRRFSIFNLAVGNTPYQVVTLLTYRDAYRDRVTGAFGFMVNLSWVRQSYFQRLTRQIAQAANVEPGVTLNVRDEHGAVIIGAAQPDAHARSILRPLPLAFFDPLVADVDPASEPVAAAWSAEAVISEDPVVLAAHAGARQSTVLALLAASLIVVNYVLISRTAAQSARVADMRATFVQGVTHELKTPVATIRAIGETLAAAEAPTAELTREFATISAEEAKRLTRLIDNLLAYSRITDVTEAYQFEAVSLSALIPDVVREFSNRLASEHVVDVNVDRDLPPIRADLTAIRLVLSNLIDNAIRYTTDRPYLRVSATRRGARALVDVEDHGAGIAAAELADVTRKFYRGRSAASGGSGLGLAIVDRIVRDHGGKIEIHSTVGEGTRVSVTFPLWEPGAAA